MSNINLRTDCKTALLIPTSMGIRMTPDNGQPVHSSKRFTVEVTSAESNVASVSSYLGLPVKVLTTFVAGSPIARMIKDNLAGRHIDYEGPDVEQGGPWGLSPPDQYRGQRPGFPRTPGPERPRRRSRPDPQCEGLRPRPDLRRGGRPDRPPVRL